MDFSQIKWQNQIVENLTEGVRKNTLRHAFLFIGESNASFEIAEALANSLLCDKRNGNMCKICPSCAKLTAGSHPDKIIVEKLPKKASLGIDRVRDVISSMYITPMLGKEKIFIVRDASLLTVQAQNALLKVIEEPPEYGRIILCAEKEDSLLPTVLSRIPHKFKLSVPTTDEICAYLEAKYPENKKIAAFCAFFSQNNPYLAEKLIQNNGDFDKRKRLCIFLNQMCGKEKSVVFDFCGYLKDNADEFSTFSEYLTLLFRDMLFIKLKLNSVANRDLSEDISALSEKFSTNGLNNAVNRLAGLNESIKKYHNFEGFVLSFLFEIWEDLHDRNNRS